jgi:hypothetical protein
MTEKNTKKAIPISERGVGEQKLLFTANRARHDIQMAVSFLTTRVKAPDEDDWGKLVRVLKYINGTRYMKLILSADEMNFTVHWYVDGSHQCHKD